MNMYAEDNQTACEWCGNDVTDDEIAAVKPKGHAVMMCERCMPDNPDW